MKIKINTDGYSHLLNEEKKEVFCIKRHPVQTIVPDKLGQPVAIEIPTRSSLCGDHCPFFSFELAQDQKSGLAQLCENHVRGINEIINEPTDKLKLIQ